MVAGADVTPDAGAALLDTGSAVAEKLLAALAAAHLVEERLTGRYAMHDLVRAYAHERAIADDAEPDRLAAAARLDGWYIANARAATLALFPGILLLPDAHTHGEVPEADARAFLDMWLAGRRMRRDCHNRGRVRRTDRRRSVTRHRIPLPYEGVSGRGPARRRHRLRASVGGACA